jgi:hypothetical protein
MVEDITNRAQAGRTYLALLLTSCARRDIEVSYVPFKDTALDLQRLLYTFAAFCTTSHASCYIDRYSLHMSKWPMLRPSLWTLAARPR